MGNIKNIYKYAMLAPLMPAGGNAGNEQTVGTWKNRTCQQPCPDVQAIVFVSQVYTQVNGPEKIPDPESFHLVKTRCGIEHKDFEEVIVF
jgi:hypothetical protein